ncbi:MAG: 50S ribosomal protein L18a [Candidatus Diapherotrites archaeon]|uniref:Large ribosomal subunit protein eL20 n=1 Tax=Candidatus Iainarchaeum sp. TaxID=3101447 RepID=A0A7K4BZX7_9ARCH|nr:50S ribosomal protein L18a [Candidatus Diapherotrites archaeon]
MTMYEVKGTYTKRGVKQKYTKTIKAPSEKLAKEKTYALIGGKQKILRIHMTIDEIKVIK